MKLISQIAIKGFRSFGDGALTSLGDFTALAGLNNSGKSNVLRALNAFFNGHTEPGAPVSVDRDYFRPDLQKKKAKRIRVSVTFSLPEQFKFRKGLGGVETFFGGRSFCIAKEWARSSLAPAYYLNDEPKPDPDSRQKIDQFLELINFRYIPNRVLPIEVIRSEHQALRDVLIRRLGKKGRGYKKAFNAIRVTSEKMLLSLAKRFRDACPDAGDLRLATPLSWEDMIFALGYRLARNGIETEDVAQGSGIQSLLMLETLYLIDHDYFQKFGWRQGAIWAVEEPESSLHYSLEAKVASFLAAISRDQRSRLQVLCTTHSELLLQYADRAIVIEQKDGQSVVENNLDIRSAFEKVSRAGISRWVHPILHYPLDPLILTEGKTDQAFLEEAFKHVRPKRVVRPVFLEQLSPSGKTGGVDELVRYVRENAQVIKSRPKDSPVVVVLDWDAAAKKDVLTKPFSEADPFRAMVWPQESLNPKLGKTFHGIERCYSDRIIGIAESRGVNVARRSDGICVIDKEDYGKAKEVLCQVVTEGIEVADLVHAQSFIEGILKTAGALN